MRWQQHLGNVINLIFPGKDVLTNVRKNAHIVHPSSGRFLELDFWIPDLKLAFEYQDPHHYVSTWYSNKIALDQRGETLVTVPCWWDGKEDSLIATVRLTRPELFPLWNKLIDPISPIAPVGFFNENEVRGVGPLMLASFAHATSEELNFTSWWISEKYDGIRACWNPDDAVLFGKPLVIPRMLSSLFPEQYLDGEIWFGRGSFHQSLSFFDDPEEQDVDKLKMVALDYPQQIKQDSPFEHRYALLLESISPSHPFIVSPTKSFSSSPLTYFDGIYMNVPSHACVDTKYAKQVTKVLLECGSEGSVVRAPKSPYQQGRSEALIKFKAHRDQEALVVRLESDGSYTVRMSDGTLCEAPLSPDWDLTTTPSAGDVISLVYTGYLPNGSLKIPRICNLRPDLTWIDVLTADNNSQSATLVSRRALSQANQRHQQGYWTSDEGRNIRVFFDSYANEHNFDPLVAANWYQVSRADFLTKGGQRCLVHFNGSLITALGDTYPEVYFDETKFSFTKKSYWADKSKRREFLMNFAKRMNFDPLDPNNWYSMSQKTITQIETKISSLFQFYNNSYTAALMDLLPEIGIDPSKFTKIKQGYWNTEKHRRAFFDNYAVKRKLDPLNPDTWYPIEKKHIMDDKGWRQVLYHYNESVQTAVMTLYPDIGLDQMKFYSRSLRGYWSEEKNIRKFFDTLALKVGFDPLLAQNWYDNVNQDTIGGEKGGWTILGKHGSYAAAISSAYPSLNIEGHKFKLKPPPTQTEKRAFFETFASQHGFDPLIAKNWYRITSAQIAKVKGGAKILSYYDNSLIVALQQLFPDIGIDPYLFSSCRVQNSHWREKDNVKRFFDEIARRRGFDTEVSVEPWYRLKRFDVTKEKGGAAILSYFQGSHVAALMSIYPTLEASKFKFLNVPHYQTPQQRKAFFDRVATSKGFDPLVASNWESISQRDLIGKKGGSAILSNFDGSLLAALRNTYQAMT